ncbi:GpE family phage tail protein [Enterobacteriaceae bacterium ML5]|nr:GpE family phage tail protein [Enterobacteriaceae bacterium ML5]
MEDVIADIAAIFHWPRSELEAMPVPELVDWQARAVERFRMMMNGKPQY